MIFPDDVCRYGNKHESPFHPSLTCTELLISIWLIYLPEDGSLAECAAIAVAQVDKQA